MAAASPGLAAEAQGVRCRQDLLLQSRRGTAPVLAIARRISEPVYAVVADVGVAMSALFRLAILAAVVLGGSDSPRAPEASSAPVPPSGMPSLERRSLALAD